MNKIYISPDTSVLELHSEEEIMEVSNYSQKNTPQGGGTSFARDNKDKDNLTTTGTSNIWDNEW